MPLTKETFDLTISDLVKACEQHTLRTVAKYIKDETTSTTLRIVANSEWERDGYYSRSLFDLYKSETAGDIYDKTYQGWLDSKLNHFLSFKNSGTNYNISINFLPINLSVVAKRLNTDFGTNFSLAECDFINKKKPFFISNNTIAKSAFLKESFFLNEEQNFVIQFSFKESLTFWGQMINHASETEGLAFLAILCTCLVCCALISSLVVTSIAATGAVLSSVGFFATIPTSSADDTMVNSNSSQGLTI